MQQRSAQTDANITRLNDLINTRLPPPLEEEGEDDESDQEQPILVEDPYSPGRLIVQHNLRVVRVPATNPNPTGNVLAANPDITALTAKMAQLEESIAKAKKVKAGGIDLDHLCLYPNAKLPNKFKMPDLAKLDGHAEDDYTGVGIYKKEAKESFADFVKRWRAKATLMTERPSEKDQLRIISRNLQPDYARHLVLAQASTNFETFFDSGLAIEDALQSGILSMGETSNPPKAKPRAYSGNTNALFGGRTYSNTATSRTNASSSNTTNHITDVNQVQTPQNNRPRGQPRSFSAIEAPLSSVLEKFLLSPSACDSGSHR
ncbi:hypothetical protein RHMOL_Rhmol08G0170500 [Rhododendron molle]|uniref:Uncharacterized protein n=1 Tax=Rhododendron molle TaxID=49168 RepID=A0ACC0MPZ8_RHOML|nr:hypothetical protein RHMOL_Rhmol08G0170500 [Rhododendron molle]